MRLPSLLSLFLISGLVGCAAPEVAPAPDDARLTPKRLPLPRYVTDARAPWIGGAAWRAGHRAHALGLDGQRCGLTQRGEVRCRRPAAESMPLFHPTAKPTG